MWPVAIYPFPLMAYKPSLCPSHGLNSHLHEEMFLAHKVSEQPWLIKGTSIEFSVWCSSHPAKFIGDLLLVPQPALLVYSV